MKNAFSINRELVNDSIRKWRSEIEFLKTESRFFQRLLNDHFEDLSTLSYAQETRGLVEEISELNFYGVEESIAQLQELQSSLDDNENELDYDSRRKFEELEQNMHNLHKNVMDLKKRIFNIVEQIIRANKQ